MRRPIRQWLVVSIAVAAWSTASPLLGQWRFDNVARVVTVADVHGAYTELVELLRLSDVIDDETHWIGGQTHLVSLGDLVDRGADSRKVMDLLMRLQQEAPLGGGQVHVLLGNHEQMDLIGDLRYVSDEEYAAFADEEPPALRQAVFARFRAERGLEETAEAEAEFAAHFPPGYFGHRQAFSPDGRYGRWLLSLPALIVIDDTAFVHGGLSELIAEAGADSVNRELQSSLRRYLSLRRQLADKSLLPLYQMQHDLEIAQAALAPPAGAEPAQGSATEPVPELEPEQRSLLEAFVAAANAAELNLDGPLWYRGSVYCRPILERAVLDAALQRLGTTRVVVGHTPTDSRQVSTLYGGRIIMLDTGMLADAYSGRPAALIIEHGEISAQYLAPVERAAPRPGGYHDAYGLSEAELFDALELGEIVGMGTVDAATETTPGEPQAVSLRYRDRSIHATFYAGDRGGPGALELAAFELDRLLGLDLVPPTVERRVGDDTGALQLRYPDTISEAARVENRIAMEQWCGLDEQVQLMYGFDLLIANKGRSAANVLHRQESSNLALTDHRLAFGTERSLPAGLADGALALEPRFEQALIRLEEDDLEAEIGDRLNKRQIRALLLRRDELVERF